MTCLRTFQILPMIFREQQQQQQHAQQVLVTTPFLVRMTDFCGVVTAPPSVARRAGTSIDE